MCDVRGGVKWEMYCDVSETNKVNTCSFVSRDYGGMLEVWWCSMSIRSPPGNHLIVW